MAGGICTYSRERHGAEVADNQGGRPMRVLHPVLDLSDVAHGGGEGNHQHSLRTVDDRFFPNLIMPTHRHGDRQTRAKMKPGETDRWTAATWRTNAEQTYKGQTKRWPFSRGSVVAWEVDHLPCAGRQAGRQMQYQHNPGETTHRDISGSNTPRTSAANTPSAGQMWTQKRVPRARRSLTSTRWMDFFYF